MNYDEKEITTTFEIINGKEVPVYRIPTGMSSPNKSKVKKEVTEDYDDYESEEDETYLGLYDEENNFFIAEEFID